MRKNVLLEVRSKGIRGVLRQFAAVQASIAGVGETGAEASSKLAKGFGDVKAEGKRLAASITAVFGAAVAVANDAAKEWSRFETGLLRANRMLEFGQGELDQFGGRMRALVDGPLGSVPGILDTASDAVYSYISALGQTGDQDAIFRDLTAAAQAAAVSGNDLNEMMANGAKIAAVAGNEHGTLAEIFDLLASAEQYAVGTLDEVTTGVQKAVGPMSTFGGDTTEAAAAVATLTKTGRNAVESATMLRMTLSKFQREQAEGGVLQQLGVQATDFIGIIEELSEKELGWQEQQRLFGARYAGFMMKLVERSDQLRSTYDALGESNALIARQFDAYSHTTLAETTRRTNELKREQVELGERMQEVAPFVENLKTQIKIGIGELAEFVIKNKELAIGAIFAIRAAMVAFKATSPLGWLIAAVELAVGAVLGLISLFDDSTQKSLDAVRASKQYVEEQRANIDQTREQTRAQLENAKANNASAETIAELEKAYHSLTETSNELTQSIHALAIQEAELNAAVAIEAAAAEIGEGKGEAAIERELKLMLDQLASAERRAEVTNDLAILTAQIADSDDESAKIQSAMVLFLEKNTGLTREQAERATEEVTSREEAKDLLDAINASLSAATIKEQELLAAQADVEKGRWRELDIVDAMMTLREKGVEMSRAEARAALEAVDARRQQLITEAQVLAVQFAQAKARGDISNIPTLIEEYKALSSQVQQLATDYNTARGAASSYRAAAGEEKNEIEGAAGADRELEKIAARHELELELAKSKELQLYDYRLSLYDSQLKAEQELQIGSLRALFDLRKEQQEKLTAAQEDAYRAIAGVFTRGLRDGMLDAAVDFVSSLAMQMLENAIVMALLTLTGGGFSWAGLLQGTPFGGFFASGGYVPATPGGQMIIAGEGGQGEYVIPENLIESYSQYGLAAPAAAAAQVYSQQAPSVNVQSPTVNVPPAQVALQLDSRGLWAVVQQGQRRELRAQG